MNPKLDHLAERIGPRGAVLASIALTVLVGWVQRALGPELTLSMFFVLPVALTTWYCGRTRGVMMCGFAAIVALWGDVAKGEVYSHAMIPVWNATGQLAFHLVLTHLLLALRTAHEREATMADTDPLTGLANSRRFYEVLEVEIARSRRFGRTFTLAYLDADNFKVVNDQRGHAEGDRVLREIAATLTGATRVMDVVARLGGDEFAVLFPECDEALARHLLPRVREGLLDRMRSHGWPVGFSFGAVSVPPGTADVTQAIHAADRLMFAVKRSGKNEIRYEVLSKRDLKGMAG